MLGLKILIVEDDLMMGQGLEERLLDFGYAITDNVANSQDALLAFRRRLPDLVICDIELKKSKLDGIQLAAAFNQIEKVPIIFLTSFGDSATVERAKKVNPAYYLIKPCTSPQLQVAIDFALENFMTKNTAEAIQSLKVQRTPSCLLYASSNFFFVKDRNKYVRVEIADIVLVEALGYNVKIITDDYSVVLTANLSSFSKQVQDKSLVRVHRSHVININKLISFDAGRAFLRYKNEIKEVSIGGTYREEFQKTLPRLMSD